MDKLIDIEQSICDAIFHIKKHRGHLSPKGILYASVVKRDEAEFQKILESMAERGILIKKYSNRPGGIRFRWYDLPTPIEVAQHRMGNESP